MEVNGVQQLSGYRHSSFCVQQKKEIHKGLKQLEGEYMKAEFLCLSELIH